MMENDVTLNTNLMKLLNYLISLDEKLQKASDFYDEIFDCLIHYSEVNNYFVIQI